MFSFFKRKSPAPVSGTEPDSPPLEGIRYDPDLIGTLKEDHQVLLEHYQRIADKAAENRYREVRAELGQFKTLFHSHILVENVKLYVYLNHNVEIDETRSELVREMRREMRHIGKAVNQFIATYDVWPWSDELALSFPKALEQIGAALSERIETEEASLYPLYQAPEATP
ncbi:MAG: hemerythrin domain-containing protein [Sedimenticola sp.]|nr:hemerythrin domain-containing protein [Sedimenticola sp.]